MPRSAVEYVYVTDSIRHYPLGFNTRDGAIVAGVNLYTRQHFPPDTDSIRHAFGVHRADCERVDTMSGIECDSDKPNSNCWEGVVEAHP